MEEAASPEEEQQHFQPAEQYQKQGVEAQPHLQVVEELLLEAEPNTAGHSLEAAIPALLDTLEEELGRSQEGAELHQAVGWAWGEVGSDPTQPQV